MKTLFVPVLAAAFAAFAAPAALAGGCFSPETSEKPAEEPKTGTS